MLLGVGVLVGISVGVLVGMSVGVLVGVSVGDLVGVAVSVGVLVGVAVSVEVAVAVGVAVEVAEAVGVGVEVGVAVCVCVGVRDGVGEAVAVGVEVCVGVVVAVEVALGSGVRVPTPHWAESSVQTSAGGRPFGGEDSGQQVKSGSQVPAPSSGCAHTQDCDPGLKGRQRNAPTSSARWQHRADVSSGPTSELQACVPYPCVLALISQRQPRLWWLGPQGRSHTCPPQMRPSQQSPCVFT